MISNNVKTKHVYFLYKNLILQVGNHFEIRVDTAVPIILIDMFLFLSSFITKWKKKTAYRELFGMAFGVLHLLPAAGRLFRIEYVRRSGGGELPPLPGGAGERGTSTAPSQASPQNGEETTK